MKIYDCTTFYSEHMMLDVRFHALNDYVEKFIVTESLYSHSGQPKKLNFDINNYPKFKDKIIYLVIDQEPDDLIKIENTKEHQGLKRNNSLKRIELSYNYMMKATENLANDDLIILSDNDEIPNLNSKQFKQSHKNVFIFKQLFFYYKFNLLYDKMVWPGTKGCIKKKLQSLSWLRNIKLKKYPFWRLDTLFSHTKYIDINIIKDGGWHFTNIKTPEDMYEKFMNFGHHDEFKLSGLTIDKIKDKVKRRELFYNHFVDSSNQNKWESDCRLMQIDIHNLPEYLINNKSKYKEWFDI